MLQKTLIVDRKEIELGKYRYFGYRCNDVTQGNLQFQRTELDWPYLGAINLQIVQGSTKAFLVVHPCPIWNEVDMRDFPINTSADIQFDATVDRTQEILYHQISSDGQYLGCVYCVSDESISDRKKVLVQMIDLKLSVNDTTSISLCENLADDFLDIETCHTRETITFSPDLSILFLINRIYDLSLTTHEATTARFSWSMPDTMCPWYSIQFSPCNRFLCLIDHECQFRIYELCRSTKTLSELCVRGARFSKKPLDCVGKFHPHLPVLLLGGNLDLISMFSDEPVQVKNYEIIEVDLARLEADKLPPPQLDSPLNARSYLHFMTELFIEFSDHGRLAWLVHYFDGCSIRIPKSYPSKEQHLIDQMPSVWRHLLIYDQKIYKLAENDNFVTLECFSIMGDSGEEIPKTCLRLTSIPQNMRGCDFYYLLPGHEEEDSARVLLVSNTVALIKVLPITMKAILAKLDEVAETLRTQNRVSEAASDSNSDSEQESESESNDWQTTSSE